MNLLISASVKNPQKYFDDRTRHLRGEIRILTELNGEIVDTDCIAVEESDSLVMKDHHKLNAGVVVDNKYVCATYGQVVSIDLRTKQQKTLISEPFFNDLHHVNYANNEFAVVNTGLEQLLIYDKNLKLKKTYNLLEGIGTEKKFDFNIDYRHVWSTKPHYVHPNYCFFYNDEWWVTRFRQKDAIGLQSGNRIDLSSYGNPHDGVVTERGIFFTTTNGWIINYVQDRNLCEAININEIVGRNQLGWCRGIYVVDNYAYVCFTMFRSSKIKEMMKWVSSTSISNSLPSHILKIDLKTKKVVNKILLNDHDCTLFSIIGLTFEYNKS